MRRGWPSSFSRARRRVQGSPTVPETDLATQRKVVTAFLAAARAGDFDALVTVLHPDVVFRVDAGARPHLAPALLAGRADVARRVATQGPRFARRTAGRDWSTAPPA
jgi:RNA polymerase sigma-70 factor (ECF subfamily)